MRVIIDRFEENIAVVELDGEMLNAPRALFAGAHEGDTVEITVIPREAAHPAPAEQSPTDDAAGQKKQVEDAVLRIFGSGEAPKDAPPEDSPADLFQKLRNKKKHR